MRRWMLIGGLLAVAPATAAGAAELLTPARPCQAMVFAPVSTTETSAPVWQTSWTSAGDASVAPFAGVHTLTASCETPLPDLHEALADALAAVPPQTAPPPVAFEYSRGYQIRNTIHHDASYAMLPLFVTEAVLGQQLFNNPAQAGTWKRSAHRGIAAAITGLFAVNTVTGVWNLMESRKDPNSGSLPLIHGVLMLVADAGFVATAFLVRPSSHSARGLAVYDAKKNQHMTIAYASISVATVGYLIMLFR